MKKKILDCIVIVLCFMLCLTGCQAGSNKVGDPPVEMQNITQDSKDGYITFQMGLPKWVARPVQYFSIGCFSESNEDAATTLEEARPYLITIENYNLPNASRELSAEEKQIFKNMFSGKTDSYEQLVDSYVAYLIESKKNIE